MFKKYSKNLIAKKKLCCFFMCECNQNVHIKHALIYCVIMVQSMYQIQEHKFKKVNFIL